MLIGYVDRADHEMVVGWAADQNNLRDDMHVIIYVNGQRFAEVPCDIPRPDLSTIELLRNKNRGFRYKFPRPLPSVTETRVDVRFAESGAVVPNGERILPADGPARSLLPILISAPGRSGTTLLMSRLSQSDNIVAAESYPFELRLFAYYSTAYHVLTSTADFTRSMHPDRLEGSGFAVGFNPFSRGLEVPWFKEPKLAAEVFSRYAPAELLHAFRQIIIEYYERLKQDQNKLSAKGFAEKGNNLDKRTRAFAHLAFPGLREIVLIRDPRDLLCSYRDYFKTDQLDNMNNIIAFSADLVAISKGGSKKSIFVRYEDFVTGGNKTFEELSDFLGIEVARSDRRAREDAIFKTHATSASPESSIGRWKKELDSDTIALVNKRCGEFLDRFGYMK